MKTEVYSWRISSATKSLLEDEARRRGTSTAGVLEDITTKWFAENRNGNSNEDAEQAALRQRVMATVGTIRGGDPRRAWRAGELVRKTILRKHKKELRAALRRQRPH
jgi:hypothetical protein